MTWEDPSFFLNNCNRIFQKEDYQIEFNDLRKNEIYTPFCNENIGISGYEHVSGYIVGEAMNLSNVGFISMMINLKYLILLQTKYLV